MTALILKNDRTGEGLYAARGYRLGELVVEFEHVEWRAQRDRHTIEHPFGGHLYHPVLAKAAHACEPNCRVSFHDRALVAIRPIAVGEAITFDYRRTESAISHPFNCACGSRRCRRRIA
jgi:hypothetical protein